MWWTSLGRMLALALVQEWGLAWVLASGLASGLVLVPWWLGRPWWTLWLVCL